MPRIARCVFPNVAHHITQRGNRREQVFFKEKDREIYLSLLKEYSDKYDVLIIAYCLMSNHLHLVAIPTTDDGLQKVLRPLHMRYAQMINREKGWKGHLWQGRYFSSPLDEEYFWSCIRYVENNPVRAKIVKRAEDYKWSSARHHCNLEEDELVTKNEYWQEKIKSIDDWSKWLIENEESKKLNIIRRNVEKGLPCGSEKFIRMLENIKGRFLKYRQVGRPKNND